MHRYLIIFLFLFLLVEGSILQDKDREPRCYSRFDWEDKLLQRVIESDFNLKQQMTRLEEAMNEIREHNVMFQDWKTKIATDSVSLKGEVAEKLNELKDWKTHWQQVFAATSMLMSTTYIRWGRTSCPGNGSEAVYNGFSGGSHFSHSGAAASMLCLPKDPDWDARRFSDALNSDVGLIYGAEYEDRSSRGDQLFGEDHYQRDVPCVVCNVKKRSTVIMIPGKTKCYAGWTLEYSGYLMAGHYGHSAARDYYCIDKDPEDLPDGLNDDNGYILYFVEARCGSLRCPPYVHGREFQCVVCSK